MKNRKLWVSIMAGFLAVVMLLSLIVSILPTQVSAASSSEIKSQLDELKEEKAEIQAQIKEIQGQYQANANEIQDMVNQKNLIDQEIGLLHDQVENINTQIAAYSLLIADKQEELDAAQERLAYLNEKNKERIRAMEEEGNVSYWTVLFRANSFSDLLDRMNMIEEIAASDRRRLEEMSMVAEQIATAQAELEVEKAALEQTREELAAAELELEAKRAEADAILVDLAAKGREFEQMLEESEEAQDALMVEIAQKEKEYKDAQYKEWLATYVPPTTIRPGTTTPSVQAPSSSGWICPVPYYTLTSPFGMRLHPIHKVWRMHQGVDMAAAQGTPIYAAKSGKVTTASFQAGGAGYYVSINHGDGFASIYMHMTHFIVSPGQYVTTGQVIGYVGSTGGSTGPHLHFGISYNGTYVNPMAYVG
jgi:murein DD-endopeptidase MepM/ murein hydrolase activator NlpD